MWRYIILLLLSIGSFVSLIAQDNWKHIGAINGAFVQDIHRSVDGNLYAGAFFDAYRSTDNGVTWSMIWKGSNEFTEIEVVVSHDLEDAVALFVIASIEPGGVFVSLDDGATWNAFEMPAAITDLAFARFKGSISGKLYVRGFTNDLEGKLLSASDNGRIFIEELALPDASILDVVESPGGAVFAPTTEGLYRKLPGGAWEIVETAGVPVTSDLILTAFEEAIMVDDLTAWRSSDYGDTWEDVSSGLKHYTRSWLSSLSSGSTLLAGEVIGNKNDIYILKRGATSWEPLHTDLPFRVRHFIEARNGDILGANRIGFTVMREDSSAITTQRANLQSLPVTRLTGDGDWLYAVTFQGDILRSNDGGATWELSFFPEPRNDGLGVEDIITTSGGIVLASLHRGKYRSTDNGSTWTLIRVSDPDRRFHSLYETRAGVVFATMQTSNTIYRSDNEGANWSTAGELPSGLAWGIAENADSSIIVSSNNGLWRLEGEATWVRFGLEGEPLLYTLGSRKADDIVALGEQNDMDIVYRGAAHGADWEAIPIGLSGESNPLILDVARSVDGGVLSASADGLFYLAPQARQWREDELSIGLDDLDIPIALYDAGQATYTVTFRGAVYKREATTSVADNRIGDANDRIRIHPQPAEDHSTIKFYSDAPGVARITLYDALGVPTLQTDRIMQMAGAQSFDIDTRALAAGLYIVGITADRQVYTGALILAR